MRKAQAIAVWSIVSALYIAGCFWLYFGTQNFDNLDLLTSREDFRYMDDAHITALLGVLTTATPIICLWLEFKVTRRFGRLRFWVRRYGGSFIAAAMAAVFLWFRSHAAIERPYSSNDFISMLSSLWCGLILNHCIIRAHRARIISR